MKTILLACAFEGTIIAISVGFCLWFDKLLKGEDNGNKTIKQEKLMP